MTSQKREVGRRSRMLEIAAEAPSILSSGANQVQNSLWSSRNEFLEDYPAFSEDRPWKDDDQSMDVMALVVLDEFSTETLDEILRVNTEVTNEPYLWLADRYDTLPDWDPSNPAEGTAGPIGSDWRSPFVGSSVEEVASFIQAAAKPPKPLCKRFFAVLQKENYEHRKQLMIYKIIDGADDGSSQHSLQTVPCPVNLAGFFFAAYDRYYWDRAVHDQALYFGEGFYWNDDNGDNQVMALIVLDEFPTETINKILQDNIEECGHPCLWLADDYTNLPDYRPNCDIIGTQGPISDHWRSPFVGRTIQDAANFIRSTPKPPKPLCRRFFAVLQREQFEQEGKLLMCKILPERSETEIDEENKEVIAAEQFKEDGRSLLCKSDTDSFEFEVQMITINADHAGSFFAGFDRSTWWELGDCAYD